MKLVLDEPKFLKESITILSELVNEVRIKIDKNKLEIIAMDPAAVAMVIFKILSSSFSEYDVREEKEIGVSLDHVKQILKRAKPSDSLVLELDEDKNKLNIKLRGTTTRAFSLSLLEVEESEQKIPTLTFSGKVEMKSAVFSESVEDMDIISDAVSLLLDKEKFELEAEGTVNKGHVEILPTETTVIKAGNVIKSKYSLEYLKKMTKGSKLSENITLQFDKDYPLKIEYKVMDRIDLCFILAPRVENY